jgi:hypothetical protein
MTPEARIKKLVSIYLDSLSDVAYYHMPVPTGYGKRNSLDYILCIHGHFIAIETKAPGEWLTPLQRQTARSIVLSGGKVFIISGSEGLDALKRWVERHEHRLLAR